MPRHRVFLDTNVILEAFRTACWSALCEHFAIETVEKCIEEALTGDPDDARRISVESSALLGGLAARHPVTPRDLAKLVLDHPACQGLDAGEQHLLAFLHAKALLPHVQVVVSTADKAAIVATERLGGLDALVSLERLAEQAGATRGQAADLRRQYRQGWLDEVKLKIRLGLIP